MRDEQEIRDKLEELKDRHDRLVAESSDKAVNPDGSEDSKHIAAVSVYGEISMLRWILEEE